MSTIDKSFIPILDNVLLGRLQKCQSDADDELFGCQYAINASINTTWLGHYVHRMQRRDPFGDICNVHTLKTTQDFLAAFQLVRSSMHSQAANAIRLGCETAWQNTWFHENPDRADEWKSGQRFQPRQIRKEISTFQTQRKYLYDELSRMAHPNESAMTGLVSPYAGPKTINVDVLLPVYDLSRIRATLFRLFYSVLIAQLDFDRCHLGFLTNEQRDAYGIQSKSMLKYYDVIKSNLPTELHLD